MIETPPWSERIVIFIPGSPVPKERAGSARRGHRYTPKKTAAWETAARMIAAAKVRGAAPLDGPLEVCTTMIFEIPKTWPQWQRGMAEQGLIMPTKKPDADNVLKAVKDSLNGIVYKDDCYVTDGDFAKEFGHPAGVRVTIRRLPGWPCQITKRPEGVI